MYLETVLVSCTGSDSQHTSLCLHICQPLEPVPETPHMRLALTRRQQQRLLCKQALRRNVGSGGLGHRWCSPSTAQQILNHQISTFHRSTSNELRRKHPSRVASELDYAPGNLQISHLSCHVTVHNMTFHKAHVLVNVKALFSAEAAQLQKDLVEIRTRPTSLLSITHLKDHLLALEHRHEFLSRTLP